ncbi:dTDP-Rha--alpha-D-GlcNAc-pyrophosphate polyprenol alpha-3-L-rhamnosyltransferase [Urechidicola croceus]|uniref:dTDP-Rha--alpha-D-GlcNAc-pyrophosphate polyprenol alpha-3-L-rhamnosyltransferase n=1 Tax=Urechidicola croceus TaxID=1850246 RepID=A0A1D8P4E4_9FLAO|nr:dTDP-Rha--alpha-D-GlcNAc-pyrophosphate polyprenol alpha-3-L-rhamnosyltransferase [Urechidicola croceus]
MKIAVIILNWNGQKLLDQFLPTIIRFSNPEYCDIYVADNASTDNSINFIKENFSSVKIIQNNENGGFAKGYNDALKNVDADIYALVNSDIEVTKNWLHPIISEFENDKNTAIIQPKILDFKDKGKFEYAGAGGGFIDKYGYLFCRGRIFESLEHDNQQYNDTTTIFWASGACFFIRSFVYHELDGFDEDYFAHQEEVDLCWRASNLGYTIKYVGSSSVYHIGGATLQNTNPKKTYLNYRNSLYSLVKNLPKKELFSVLFTRLFLDGISGIKFLAEIKPRHFFSIIIAHFSFYYNLPKTITKRKKILNHNEKYYYTKSIIWQYFIKRKKWFNQL